MTDTFDPIAFLSAVSGDGDWSDEFLEWYESGKWLSDELACAVFVAEKFIRLKADRDSWYQQASDRVDDAVRFAAERDAALSDCALLRKVREEVQDWRTTNGGDHPARSMNDIAEILGLEPMTRGEK